MKEVEQISRAITDFSKRAKIILGISQDKKYRERIRVTLLAIGTMKAKDKKPVKTKIVKRPVKRLKRKIKKPSSVKTAKLPRKSPKKKRVASKITRKPKTKVILKVKTKRKTKTKVQVSSKKQDVASLTPPLEKQEDDSKKETVKISDLKAGENSGKVRRNALDLKKSSQELEEQIQEQEKQWDTPAFLRKKE